MTDTFDKCATCDHYPAYHDQEGWACRAWTDANPEGKCPCLKWVQPGAAKAVGTKPWGWQRKDLQD